jgi:transaldolase
MTGTHRRIPGAEIPQHAFVVDAPPAGGCDVITVIHNILTTLSQVGKDLDDFSLETVQVFRSDAVKAGYRMDRRPC